MACDFKEDMMAPVKIGVIGCGNISDVYFESCKNFDSIEVVACADLLIERTKAKAKKHGIPKVCTPNSILADPEIEIILNLTVPAAHGEVSLAALESGKHVHSEKPLALERKQAEQMLELAETKGLLVGCAPDTFFGGGLQTCRKIIDDGQIGDPVAATVFMMYHGPESFHPDPDFFYQPGGGPMFDMGPYYLTALAFLMGPVKKVAGMNRITFPKRQITSEPHAGETIKVTIPTHVTGLLEYVNGAIATIVTSFDVWEPYNPWIEIHGTLGSLRVPDANFFGGKVSLRAAGEEEWQDVPLTHGYLENHRGIGLADMAHALRSGRPHRANGQVGRHVLDIMHAIHEAAETGRHIPISTTCERPEPLPSGLRPGFLDN
jgi:predicted dehydrogenase